MDPVTDTVMKRVQTQLSEVLESAVILGVPMVDRRPMLAIYGYTDDLKVLAKAIHAKMEGIYDGPAFGPLPGTCTAEVMSRAYSQLMEVLDTAVVAGVPIADNQPVLVSYGDPEEMKSMTKELEDRMEVGRDSGFRATQAKG